MPLLGSGERIGDRLVIERMLGEGAFAEVHLVWHEFLGRQAMKLFKRVGSARETHDLLGEARLLSTLGHPNIIRVFDANTVRTPEGLRGFFTMEYIAGGNLEGLVSAYSPAVPTDMIIEIGEQIVAGLSVAHDREPPILHRDLTLANILIGYSDTGMQVRISDFGLAKRASLLTRLASAQGTYAFMAPEVLRGDGCSCASDVWSVGTIMYWLLTNRLPYHDGGAADLLATARFNRPLLAPSRYNSEVDSELDRIVLAALEVESGNRPPDASVLRDALLARREGVADRPPAPSTTATSPPTERAQRLADEALECSRVPGELGRAADLMEEAINLSPRLRELHLHRLTLWRRGVVM